MPARRAFKAVALSCAVVLVGATAFLLAGTAFGGTGPGASGNTITNALQAQTPFSPGTLDSGQGVDVVIPANTVLTPGASIFILECAAPGGVDPTTINSCDGNTGYAGGTITVNGDGSVDVMNGSSPLGNAYVIYALPDSIQLLETSSSPTHCGLGSANECVLYIGQGGGGDTGLSQPHFFSQPFQVHPDPTDSGTLNPGDGTFPADSAPAITSANHATFTKGSAGTFTVTGSGYGPPTFTETGALPAGVTLKTSFSGTSSTGVLAGTPTQSGTFPITITANNGVGTPATQSFTLTVNAAPAITSANHVTFTQGSAGTFTVTATGTPTPTLGESGTLPTGVGFNTSTGVLSGTPTQSGTFPITFSATNGVGSPASQPFTLTVSSSGVAPSITSANHVTFTQGSSGTFTVTATGTPTPTLGESGTLPTGVGFNSSTGVLSGTPTQSGTFPITFSATNGVGSPASQSFTLTVDAAPAITSANHTTFTEGSAGTFTVSATGVPAPTLGESGTLPTGVGFNASTGVLSGTPTQSGTFPITFSATNGVGSPASQSFSLVVDGPPAITSANHTTFTEGSAGTFTVTATGTPTPTFGESGTLPTGVTFTAGTGTLAGTPTETGVFPITFSATNGIGSPASQSFSLVVDGPPAITSANNTTFTEGSSGSFTVTDTGTPAPTLGESGALPTGVTFTAGTGTLAGTPTETGVFPITFTATNGIGSPATQGFTLTVLGFHISTTSLPDATVGVPYSVQLQTLGGTPPYKWKKTASLPKGLSLSSTGLLSGTPSFKAVGSRMVGVTVTSNKTSVATTTLPLNVNEAPAITSGSAVSFHNGSPGTFDVTATGFPAASFSETGPLPSGVTLSSAGVLSGTPALTGSPLQSAVFPITVHASNGIGSPANQSFTLTVIAPLTIDTTSLPGTSPGAAYSAQIAASGGLTPYKWKKLSALPKGLKLSTATGMVSGTLSTKIAPGTYSMTIEVTDKEGKVHTSATKVLTIAVS